MPTRKEKEILRKVPKEIQRVIDKSRALRKEVAAIGRQSIKEMFVGLFKEFPKVEAVRWTQYTPHFNDGEPCVFNVYEPDVRFTKGICLAKKHESNGQYPEEDNYTEGEEFYALWSFRKQQADVYEAVNTLYKTFQEIEDVLMTIFGDGVQVVVSKDGTVEAEDYDHD